MGFGYPRIIINWKRYYEEIEYNRPLRILGLGIQGSGKGSILECIAVRYPTIVDLLGASDGESLCWCKSEFQKWYFDKHGKTPKILLITGQGIEIASKFDTVNISDLDLKTMEKYNIITTAQLLHINEKDYYTTMGQIVDVIREQRLYWNKPWFVMIREAANWAYARLKVARDNDSAKADLAKFYRENRHHGVAIGLDTLRWTNIDKEIRDLADHLIVKQLGDQGLPKDLRYCYRYWSPKSLRWLRKDIFGIKTIRGSIGIGRFDYPIWHKEEQENILLTTGIEIKNVDNSSTEDRRYGVGDFEHAEIIEKFIELGTQGKTAKSLMRSKSTINTHIRKHNMAVQKIGECQHCKHSKCQFSKDILSTQRSAQKDKNEHIN